MDGGEECCIEPESAEPAAKQQSMRQVQVEPSWVVARSLPGSRTANAFFLDARLSHAGDSD